MRKACRPTRVLDEILEMLIDKDASVADLVAMWAMTARR